MAAPPPSPSSRASIHSAYATPLSSPPLKTPSSSGPPSPDYYFAPQIPSTSGSNISQGPSTPATTPYPIITSTVTSRNPKTSASPQPPNSQSAMLQQFAMRFPAPPTLSLAAFRHPTPEVSASPPYISSRAVAGTPGYEDLPSPMDRSRRMPVSSQSPHMNIASFPGKHTLSVQLPTSIQPEMVTISANKGDKLKVVADAWHMEDDCHYEWQISFPPHDIDMSAVNAKFEADGRLIIDVRRVQRYSYC